MLAVPLERIGVPSTAFFGPGCVRGGKMPRETERAVLKLVVEILGGTEERTPRWLMRPGPDQCRVRWPLVCKIYNDLTGKDLPREMPAREYRRVDCVLKQPNLAARIVEVDESQHFNRYRAITLRLYPPDINIAFDQDTWVERSEAKKKLEGGGFGKPRPPLFPEKDQGRHQQRAFRDALADIIPREHGFEPTLRIAYFEVEEWLTADDACERMKELLRLKLRHFQR